MGNRDRMMGARSCWMVVDEELGVEWWGKEDEWWRTGERVMKNGRKGEGNRYPREATNAWFISKSPHTSIIQIMVTDSLSKSPAPWIFTRWHAHCQHTAAPLTRTKHTHIHTCAHTGKWDIVNPNVCIHTRLSPRYTSKQTLSHTHIYKRAYTHELTYVQRRTQTYTKATYSVIVSGEIFRGGGREGGRYGGRVRGRCRDR